MDFKLEYSERYGFFYSENQSHNTSGGRKLLTESISYLDLRKFTDHIREVFPDMWKGINPKFEIIQKYFDNMSHLTQVLTYQAMHADGVIHTKELINALEFYEITENLVAIKPLG